MTAGVAAAEANSALNAYRATNVTGWTTYLQWHTGDPGAAGTANVSAVTTRLQVTFNAASSGSMTLSSIGSSTMTATETITHVSLWDATSSGNFKRSIALSASKSVSNGDSLTMTTLTLAYTPIAA